MRRVIHLLCVSTCLAGIAANLRADDWPQWMGPTRDGHLRETSLVTKFPENGLPILWRTPIGGGYAGPAVVAGRVFVTDFQRETGEAFNDPSRRATLQGKERVLCLDASTGKIIWQHAYECAYEISYPCGPRATPTVAGDNVYVLGAEGNLFCFEAKSGKIVWQKELKKEYKTNSPIWGFSAHPLVDGDRLYCVVGGEGSIAVAFDRHTGREVWRALSARDAGYCPPTLIEAAGQRQLIIWHPQSINSLDPTSGKVLWSVPLEPMYDMSIMAPRKSGDFLFASGIGDVGALLKLSQNKPGAEIVWQSDRNSGVYCANSTPIIDNGVIYGCCCRGGQLRGVRLEDGKRLWESFKPTTGERRAGHGTAYLAKNGDRYFIFSETGDLVLAKLSAESYDEISRFHVLEPTGEAFGRSVAWSHPAFANKCLFARNDKEIVCVSLAEKP